MKTAIAEISKSALLHNLKYINNLIGPNVYSMPMLKADAYGHDSVLIAKILQAEKDSQISHIGVARLKEAIKLKKSGINIPIVLVQGILTKDDLEIAIQNNFEIVIYNNYHLELLNNLEQNTLCKIWLKIDTGMHRLGFNAKEDFNLLKEKIDKLKQNKKIAAKIYLMSHLSSASFPESLISIQQYSEFDKFAKIWDGPKTFANSGAIIKSQNTYYDLIRPGIMLYGISPFQDKTGLELGLRPVMQFKAYILDIKKLNKGDFIGYNAKFECPKDMKVAVISVGYGDGYPWDNTSSTYVFYKNKYLKVLGTISMDMMVIDCDEIEEEILLGDTVELWGNNIPVESLAEKFNTIPYELVTKITSRVDRVLV